MPAGGAEIGTFLSYSAEKALAKHPEEFGHGAIEGVAGPEAANNASAAGTLVPLLTLGLPTTAPPRSCWPASSSTACSPGPLLFANNAPLVWGLIASLLVANFMLLVLNLPLVGLWVRLLTIPRPWLYAGILVFATLGTLGANPSSFELGLLLAFGLLGYGLRRFGYPIAPVVVGLILGPLAEQQLRRALAISQGDPSVLVHTPVALALYVIAAVALLLPVICGCAAAARSCSSSRPTRTDAGRAAGARHRIGKGVTTETMWLAAGFCLIALVYAAVGQAGASGYIAAMSLAGFAPAVMKTTALGAEPARRRDRQLPVPPGRASVLARGLSLRAARLSLLVPRRRAPAARARLLPGCGRCCCSRRGRWRGRRCAGPARRCRLPSGRRSWPRWRPAPSSASSPERPAPAAGCSWRR